MTAVSVFYGHSASNWGDLAINSGLVEMLEAAGADLARSHAVRLHPADRYSEISRESMGPLSSLDIPLDGAPKDAVDELLQLNDYLSDPDSFVRDFKIRSSDVVIVNSGEHLFESTTQENFRDLLWRVLPVIASNRARKPLVVMPSTIGPLKTRFGAALENSLQRIPVAIAFRDTRTSDLLTSDLLKEAPVLLDPGFFARGLRVKEEMPPKAQHYGLVLRLEDYGLRAGSRRSAFIQAKNRNSNFHDSTAFQTYLGLARERLGQGCTVSILVQTQADREISVALHEALLREFPDDRVVLRDPETFSEYLEQLRSLDALVTSRFHAVILASAQGVPVVGVYSQTHGHKMPGLFDLLGIAECSVRMDERTPSQVVSDLVEACATAWREQPSTRDRIERLKSETTSWLAEALERPYGRPVDTSRLQIQAMSILNRVLADTMAKEKDGTVKASMKRLEEMLRRLSEDLAPQQQLAERET